MNRRHVLVVEDEEEMRLFYGRFFATPAAKDFSARVVPDGEQALNVLRREPVDLLVLDWILPGISGASIAKALRAHPRTRALGILMVTGRSTANDIVAALDAGADDHLGKPFDEKELLARLRSIARRQGFSLETGARRRFPGLALDVESESLSLDGRTVHLTPKELELFKIFLQRPDMLHTRAYLWEALWDYESDFKDHVLNATISSLRRKLGREWGARLKPHRGKGYVFDSRS
ncbi:MAG: response regulator transcription factor [Elusimicrobia bacterium]|nr:response regulator transcription factor [Elusimicrobiota bacterium]